MRAGGSKEILSFMFTRKESQESTHCMSSQLFVDRFIFTTYNRGMAVFELGSMRIPFAGPLRLRPTGPHATSKNIGGHIVVLVDISKA